MRSIGQSMDNSKEIDVIPSNPLVSTGVEKMILVIRGKQVLLDRDLATLYGVETKRINEQVKRNIERFPEDFCFQLNPSELPHSLKSQFAALNESRNKLRQLRGEEPDNFISRLHYDQIYCFRCGNT